jgi:C4-dicarboxylate-specific signal transduction histidine kinase
MSVAGPETLNGLKSGWDFARTRLRLFERPGEKITSRWVLGNMGVIVAACLFVATALILGGAVARMLDNQNRAHKAQTILYETGALQDALTESVAAARAYALDHSSTLHHVRTQAKGAVLSHLANLRGLLSSDPASAAFFIAATAQIEKRLSLYEEFMDPQSRPGNTEHEAERLNLARINNAQITSLRDRASTDFNTYQDRVIDDMRLSMALLIVTGIASPLFGLIGIHLLRRERESQQAKTLQLELMHVQRLAIMGETSAMLAHEINQPLTAATNYLAAMRRFLDMNSADKAKAMADRTDQQIQRAASILRKLRHFIEKKETERRFEAPSVLAEDAIALLGTIDTTINLSSKIAEGLPDVLVDRVQLQQVLVNLMRNAIEAMQHCERQELDLSISESKGMIEVSLADTGPGLSPDVAAHLFEPFISTKSNGMGVGLSICQTIISQHGGRIWAEANPAGGTIFRFTLPIQERLSARW